MSEALATRDVNVPDKPGLIDEVERRLVLAGGKYQKRGEALEGFPLRHTFAPGLYVRELTIPAGGILTSKIHRTHHIWVMSKGLMSVYVEGEGWRLLHAPLQGETLPGTRRLAVAHTEVVFTTFHPTEETDVLRLEEALMADYRNPLLEGLVELDAPVRPALVADTYRASLWLNQGEW